MKRPELWKIRRELWRIYDQFSRIVLPMTIEPVRQMIYNWRADKAVKCQTTQVTLGPRVAVMVLFQPKGLLASTMFTLDHLVEQGWSVLVVSNAPLRPTDCDAVASRASVILQRPNVGYDFGAYREGMRYLEKIGHRPVRLILMNDSTWFPLRRNDTTLVRMEALDVAVAGHIFKTEATEHLGRDHIESHLLMFSSEAIAHPAFISFWKNYRMANSRTTTIARGEKALTQMAISHGLTAKGLLSVETIVEVFSKLTDDDLKSAISHIVHHKDDARAFCKKILNDAEAKRPWRTQFVEWVRIVLSNSRQHLVSATFIDPAMVHGGLGFVKKANDHRHQMARRAVLRAADTGRIPPIEHCVRAEIENAILQWAPPRDWRTKPGEVIRGEI